MSGTEYCTDDLQCTTSDIIIDAESSVHYFESETPENLQQQNHFIIDQKSNYLLKSCRNAQNIPKMKTVYIIEPVEHWKKVCRTIWYRI